jgi:hypothetical protein
LNIIKRTALYFAGKKFCREAICERADLTKLAEKPSKSVLVGILMIGFSYIIGLPAVVAFGVIAVWMNKPMIGIVGGPVIYAISTVIFVIGIKMAGKKYFMVCLKWLIRVTLEKTLGADICLITGGAPERACSKEP